MGSEVAGFSAKVAQAIKKFVVTGAAVDTNIAVTGIALTDTIKSVIAIDGDGVLGVSVLDVTAEASITSAGNIQLTTTDTTAYRLIVEYVDESVLAAGFSG